MKYTRPAVAAIAIFLCGVLPLEAQHGGGGGHSSGGFSGHSSGGRSIGHSMGHSFGHFFGHHSGGHGKGTFPGKDSSDVPPMAGAAMIHGRVVQLPNPESEIVSDRRTFHREQLTEFAQRRRLRSFPFGQNSDFGFCGSFSGFPSGRFFGRGPDCLDRGFFFDPFFIAEFLPAAFGMEVFGAPPVSSNWRDADGNQPNDENGNGDSSHLNTQPSTQTSVSRPPDTLLQLTDGSMYGLTKYWQEGDRLHYVTNYGGENSIPLERIDFEKTVQLNADQGTKFELHSKPLAKVPETSD
jgi:hypothetical protein